MLYFPVIEIKPFQQLKPTPPRMIRFIRGLYFEIARAAASPFAIRPAALYRLGDFLGAVRYRFGYVGERRSRGIYLARMARALPGRTRAELEKILLAFWRSHQKNFLELFLLPHITAANVDTYVSFQGLEHLDAALASRRGAVIAPPHFGNERLLHIALALKGYPLAVMTSAFADAPANLRTARLEPARRVHELVFPSDNPRRLYDALRRNRVIQFSPTADGATSGAWCECFGYNLFVNTTPARLALKTGAPLLPCFIYREADNRHRIVVEPPLITKDSDAAVLTRLLMAVIEKRVNEDPGQFYWMWLIIRAQEAEATVGARS